MAKQRELGLVVSNSEGLSIVEPRISLIEKFATRNLLSFEDRQKALADIAQICIEGFTVETAIQKTGLALKILQRSPDCAVRAIHLIHKLENEKPQEGVNYTVNIGVINPK